MHSALKAIAKATEGTAFDGDLWLVGGALRDELLGRAVENDFDLVTRGSSAELAELIFAAGIASFPPVTFERFGTAMVRVEGAAIEIVTARRESYDPESRKPFVQVATLQEDAQRRDFTVNTLLRNLQTGELLDPLGEGMHDLRAGVLRTPLEPAATFHDDPLRMLRAVRFRWQLGFTPAAGLYEAIRLEAPRLRIISAERIRDELVRMLALDTAPEALRDLLDLGLIHQFAPELESMVGVEQGSFHHLDVWDHTLLVMRNLGSGDLTLSLAALLHDVGKPATRSVDAAGNTRFFGHEAVGEKMADDVLRRLRFSERDIKPVTMLVKNHMRLGSSPVFTASAARRLLRDLGSDVDRLLTLVEADAASLREGVKQLDLEPVRRQLKAVQEAAPKARFESPLTGEEIMDLLDLPSGPEIGRWKHFLTERVLDGELAPGDKHAAKDLLLRARGV